MVPKCAYPEVKRLTTERYRYDGRMAKATAFATEVCRALEAFRVNWLVLITNRPRRYELKERSSGSSDETAYVSIC